MDMRAIQASIAYARALGNAGQGSGAGENAGNATGMGKDQSFSALLGDALNAATTATNKEQALATQAIAGKASLPDVAAAVNQAEITLNTVVAIRDHVVNAYQTIMNMPI